MHRQLYFKQNSVLELSKAIILPLAAKNSPRSLEFVASDEVTTCNTPVVWLRIEWCSCSYVVLYFDGVFDTDLFQLLTLWLLQLFAATPIYPVNAAPMAVKPHDPLTNPPDGSDRWAQIQCIASSSSLRSPLDFRS